MEKVKELTSKEHVSRVMCPNCKAVNHVGVACGYNVEKYIELRQDGTARYESESGRDVQEGSLLFLCTKCKHEWPVPAWFDVGQPYRRIEAVPAAAEEKTLADDFPPGSRVAIQKSGSLSGNRGTVRSIGVISVEVLIDGWLNTRQFFPNELRRVVKEEPDHKGSPFENQEKGALVTTAPTPATSAAGMFQTGDLCVYEKGYGSNTKAQAEFEKYWMVVLTEADGRKGDYKVQAVHTHSRNMFSTECGNKMIKVCVGDLVENYRTGEFARISDLTREDCFAPLWVTAGGKEYRWDLRDCSLVRSSRENIKKGDIVVFAPISTYEDPKWRRAIMVVVKEIPTERNGEFLVRHLTVTGGYGVCSERPSNLIKLQPGHKVYNYRCNSHGVIKRIPGPSGHITVTEDSSGDVVHWGYSSLEFVPT